MLSPGRQAATPAEQVTPAGIVSRRRSTTLRAWVAPQSGSTTTNSSPPSRPSASSGRRRVAQRCAAVVGHLRQGVAVGLRACPRQPPDHHRGDGQCPGEHDRHQRGQIAQRQVGRWCTRPPRRPGGAPPPGRRGTAARRRPPTRRKTAKVAEAVPPPPSSMSAVPMQVPPSSRNGKLHSGSRAPARAMSVLTTTASAPITAMGRPANSGGTGSATTSSTTTPPAPHISAIARDWNARG